MTPQELKNSILQLAIQGKLVEQRPEEGTGEELYKQILAVNARLVKERKIKKQKPLSEITEEEKPFDIPDNWIWCRIGNLFEIGPRNNVSDDEITGFMPMPLLDGGAFSDHMAFEKKTWIDIKKGFTHFADGDIVVAKITPCFQNLKSGIIRDCPSGYGAGTTELHVLRDHNKLELKFFLYFLKSPCFINDSKAAMTGTAGQQRVGTPVVANHLVPLPPLAEQKRIVDRIEELIPLVDRYEKAWTVLEEFNKKFPDDMKKSILQKAIQGKLVEQRPEEGTGEKLYQQIQAEKQKLIKEGKLKKEKLLQEITEGEIPFEIPENWKWARLNDIVIKTIKRGKSPTYIAKSNTLVFAQKCNTKAGRIDLSLAQYLDESKLGKYPAEEFMHDGDIVINSTGNGTLGRVGIYTNNDNPDELPIVPDSHVTVIRVNKDIDRLFIFYGLKYYQPFMEKLGSGSTNQTELSASIIQKMLFPIPPLAEQKRIVARIEEILPLCDKLK